MGAAQQKTAVQNVIFGSVQPLIDRPIDRPERRLEPAQRAVDHPVDLTTVLSGFLFGFRICFQSKFRFVGFLFFVDSLVI